MHGKCSLVRKTSESRTTNRSVFDAFCDDGKVKSQAVVQVSLYHSLPSLLAPQKRELSPFRQIAEMEISKARTRETPVTSPHDHKGKFRGYTGLASFEWDSPVSICASSKQNKDIDCSRLMSFTRSCELIIPPRRQRSEECAMVLPRVSWRLISGAERIRHSWIESLQPLLH
jgi:hypothetical protein